MRKGILGGTFDPIHNGHLYIAEEALKRINLDKIIFIPSGNPPHKRAGSITEPSIRYSLVSMAISGKAQFEISDYELQKQGMSYTYQTLEYLRDMDKNSELYFITGADCLIDLPGWMKVERILELCKFVVFTRPGYDKEILVRQRKKIEDRFDREIIFLDLEPPDISSSFIRESIKVGRDVKDFLPSNVYDAIEGLGLYK